jgi:hypothetical protein
VTLFILCHLSSYRCEHHHWATTVGSATHTSGNLTQLFLCHTIHHRITIAYCCISFLREHAIQSVARDGACTTWRSRAPDGFPPARVVGKPSTLFLCCSSSHSIRFQLIQHDARHPTFSTSNVRWKILKPCAVCPDPCDLVGTDNGWGHGSPGSSHQSSRAITIASPVELSQTLRSAFTHAGAVPHAAYLHRGWQDARSRADDATERSQARTHAGLVLIVPPRWAGLCTRRALSPTFAALSPILQAARVHPKSLEI